MTDQYITGTLDGFCLGVCLLLGMTLCSNWMHMTERKITPFTRMCGHCILMGCFTFTLYFTNNLWIHSGFIDYLCQAFKSLSFICIMLAGICLYTGKHIEKKDLVSIVAPYIVVIIPFLCMYPNIRDGIRFCIMMVAIIQTIILFILLRRRDKELKNIHSNLEGQKTVWFTGFYAVMILTPLVWFTVMRYHIFPIWLYNVFNMLICLELTWLAFHQQLVDWTQYEKEINAEDNVEIHVSYMEELLKQKPKLSQYENPGYSPLQAKWERDKKKEGAKAPEEPIRLENLKENLDRLMTEQKLYLDADLDINQLVRKLGTNRTYLSKLLNEDMHTTFYDYVNNLRIERAKALLISQDEKIEDIAQKCGFNSTRSFLRVFKQKVGCTPSSFRGAQ